LYLIDASGYSPALYGAPVLQGHRGQLLGLFGLEARLDLVDMQLSKKAVRFIDSAKTPGIVVSDGQHEETLFADVSRFAVPVRRRRAPVADLVSHRRRLLLSRTGTAPRVRNACLERLRHISRNILFIEAL